MVSEVSKVSASDALHFPLVWLGVEEPIDLLLPEPIEQRVHVLGAAVLPVRRKPACSLPVHDANDVVPAEHDIQTAQVAVRQDQLIARLAIEDGELLQAGQLLLVVDIDIQRSYQRLVELSRRREGAPYQLGRQARVEEGSAADAADAHALGGRRHGAELLDKSTELVEDPCLGFLGALCPSNSRHLALDATHDGVRASLADEGAVYLGHGNRCLFGDELHGMGFCKACIWFDLDEEAKGNHDLEADVS